MNKYFKYDNFYQRLENWYKEHGQLIIAFDFDDTVLGEDCQEIIDLLNRWKEHAILILYTARDNKELSFIKEYLEYQNIPWNFVNTDYMGYKMLGTKIYYNILLDDKCGMDMAYRALLELINKIENGEFKSATEK